MFPSGVYGEAVGPVPALGVIQLIFREKAKELGFIPYVGEGTTTFNSLHVKDISPFVLLVLDLALRETSPSGSVYERCFIIGGQETTWKETSDVFARVLHAEGLVASPKAKSVNREGAGEGELPMLMSSTMRIVSDRAKKLGYKNEEVSLAEYMSRLG